MAWLAVAIVFLVGFRIGLNVTNSNVIDVGYAGVIGADKLLHGKPLYGAGPRTTPTATPTVRSTTTPMCRSAPIFGWSGSWDDLPAAHAAAIAFDLLTLLGLFLLGRRSAGRRSGIVLAYALGGLPVHPLRTELQHQRLAGGLPRRGGLLVISSAPARGGDRQRWPG